MPARAAGKRQMSVQSGSNRGGSAGVRSKSPRVALVCDWLTDVGGAERVLLELHHLYPEAPIYTSKYNPKGIDWFADADVRTGWLQIFPVGLRRFLAPLRQRYFSHLDLSDYDLVISVTGAEAKFVKTRPASVTAASTPVNEASAVASSDQGKTEQTEHSARLGRTNPNTGAVHICYCHVPTQYYWQMYREYIRNPGFGVLNPLARAGLRAMIKPLRRADLAAAGRPDVMVTISDYAQEQIAHYYKREALVIHPPVDVEKFSTGFSTSREIKSKKSQVADNHNYTMNNGKGQAKQGRKATAALAGKKSTPVTVASTPVNETSAVASSDKSHQPRQGFIVTSRQVNWKRLDLCIRACLALKQPLTLIGSGPEHANLVKLAGGSPLITFIPTLPHNQLKKHLQGAAAYLFPSMEPFGIAPVEALAAGCPVIAYAKGGALDYVQPGVNGLLFDEQKVTALEAAMQEFLARPQQFPPEVVAASVADFDTKVFVRQIQQLVKERLNRGGADE